MIVSRTTAFTWRVPAPRVGVCVFLSERFGICQPGLLGRYGEEIMPAALDALTAFVEEHKQTWLAAMGRPEEEAAVIARL